MGRAIVNRVAFRLDDYLTYGDKQAKQILIVKETEKVLDLTNGVKLKDAIQKTINTWNDGGNYTNPVTGVYHWYSGNERDAVIQARNFWLGEVANREKIAQAATDDIIKWEKERTSFYYPRWEKEMAAADVSLSVQTQNTQAQTQLAHAQYQAKWIQFMQDNAVIIGIILIILVYIVIRFRK